MTRSSRVMIAAIMIAAATLFAGHSWADEAKGESNGKHGNGEMKEEFYKDLNATPEQRDQLKAHRQENTDKMKAVREQMKAKHAELRAEIGKPTVDMTKVESIKSALKDLNARMIDRKVESILSLKKILTPEQFQKMSDKMEQHKGTHGGKWMGKGKDHEGPEGPEKPEGPEERGE